MAHGWVYSINVRREADGQFHAYSADLPEAIASGATEAEALTEMREALRAAVRGRMKDGMALPEPAATDRDTHRVALPATMAAKASVYSAWAEANMTKIALATKMGRTETEIRRILDPDHGTKLSQLEEAAEALGRRLAVQAETPV